MVLSVRVAPENVELAMRVVARMQDDEASFAMFAHPADDEPTPEAYFAAWAREIDEGFSDFEPELVRLHEMGDVPAELELAVPPRAKLDTTIAPEAAFVGWLERLAERSQMLARTLVVVTYADDELPPGVLHALRRFGKLLASPRVRLIVVDACKEPFFPADAAQLPRAGVGPFLSIDGDAAARFRDFVRSDSLRVLVANGASNAELMLASLPQGSTIHIKAPYCGRVRFEQAFATSLRERFGAGAWPGAGQAELHESVDALSLCLEQHAAAERMETLVVSVDAQPSVTPQFLAQWVDALAPVMASARVKLVLLEDPEQPIRGHLRGAPAQFPSGFAATSFTLDSSSTESILSDAASGSGRSSKEQLVGLLGLASMASAHAETDKALGLVSRAEPHAQTGDDRAYVAYVRGNTLYHAQRFDEATRAYESGLLVSENETVATGWVAQLSTGLANTGLRLGAFEDAAALYQAAGSLLANLGQQLMSAEVSGWRAECLLRAGKRDEADRVLIAALASLPDHPALERDARSQRARLLERRARLLDQAGRGGEAAQTREEVRACDCPVHLHEHP